MGPTQTVWPGSNATRNQKYDLNPSYLTASSPHQAVYETFHSNIYSVTLTWH
jgi:hypothetical protein